MCLTDGDRVDARKVTLNWTVHLKSCGWTAKFNLYWGRARNSLVTQTMIFTNRSGFFHHRIELLVFHIENDQSSLHKPPFKVPKIVCSNVPVPWEFSNTLNACNRKKEIKNKACVDAYMYILLTLYFYIPTQCNNHCKNCWTTIYYL